MTDTNVSYELATMNKQERGQHSHPFYGLIPKGTWGIHMLYLGGFLFLVGYLGTGVAAITTVMLGHSARWIALYLAAEFAGVFLILVKTGRQYFAIASGQAASVVQWVVMYLMMQFVPWAQLRNPINFGGAWFSRWVTWRLIANTVVFALVVKDLVMWMYVRERSEWRQASEHQPDASRQFPRAPFPSLLLSLTLTLASLAGTMGHCWARLWSVSG